MGEDDAAPSPNEPEPQGFLDRFSLKRMHQAIIATVLTVTAAFGGLDKAQPMTPVELGSAYDNGPLKIVPHRAAILCDPARPPVLGNHDLQNSIKDMQLFGLYATVTNVADTGIALLDVSAMQAHTPRSNQPISLVREGEFAEQGAHGPNGQLTTFHAGKTEDVVLVWGVPQGQIRPGDPVTIRFNDMQFTQPLAAPIKTWGAVDKQTYGELHTQLERCAP